VAALADEQARTGRDVVLLATNFKSLHAFRVDEIRFGADAVKDDAAHVPSYYRGQQVALWFKVRDIRPLSHDQVATLNWLEERTLVEPEARPGGTSFAFGFDPFRSFHYRYPVVLRSADARELFDYSLLRGQPVDRQLFAAQAGAVFPPDVESSWNVLRKDMDPPWSLLEEQSRVFLASANLLDSLGHDGKARFAMEPSAALVLIAKAVETELRATLGALQRLAPSAAPWREVGRLESLALGEMGVLARSLADDVKAARLVVTTNLVRNEEWRGWLDEFARARNRAAHAEPLPLVEYQRHRDAVYQKNKSRLAPLAHAKRELLTARGG
jgi:hypothetical protein